MVYKKKSFKKKTLYKKPMRYEVADMALKAFNGVNTIRKLINVERKYFDNNYSALALSTTAQITDLSAIAQGDTFADRDGNSVKPQYFTLNGYLQNYGTQYDDSVVRIIIFRGVLENGVAYSATDLLMSQSVWALRNPEEKNRTTVLMDKTYVIKGPNNTSGAYITKVPVKFGKVLEKHIKFVSGSTSKENGGIYMLMIADHATLTPYFSWNARTSFTDN